MDFGEILREHRLRTGWTQEDLAEKSGISVHAISVLESGKRRPRPSSVARLAAALGLSPETSEQLIAAARGVGGPAADDDGSAAAKPGSLVPVRTDAGKSSADDDPEAAAAAPARPRNDLPRLVADFTGRRSELDWLLADRREDAPGALVISAIDGMAGIGKTALAVQAAHRLAPRYPDGQLFLDLHGHTPGREPVDAADALRRLLTALGVRDELIPAETEERAALWRSELVDRRVLVVLDNAVDAEQVAPLLPSASDCLVLVTSRRRLVDLDGAEALSLDVLSPAEATQLFGAIAGTKATIGCDEDVAEAVRLCGYLPLAIRIAAARLHHRASWKVADLVERLREQLRDTGPEGGNERVSAAFEMSRQRLEPDLQRMFRLLGLHPGSQLDARAAAALGTVSRRRAESLLEDLMDDHLIQQPQPGRYTLHDLIRDHARRIVAAEEPEQARRAALTGLFDYYRYTAATAIGLVAPHEQHLRPVFEQPFGDIPEFEEAKAARAWLDTELANLLDMARHTEQPEWRQSRYAADLSAVLFRYMELYTHPSEAVALHTHALNATPDDPERRANALRRLGSVYGRAGNYEQSLACLTETLELYRESPNKVSEAATHGNLGIVLWNLGRADEAIHHTHQAVLLLKETGDRQAYARNASNLGGLYWFLGRGEPAMEHLTQALDVFRELGIRTSETYTLNTLGIISNESGRYREAIDRFQRVVDLAREIGDRRVEGAACHGLGVAHTRLGRHEEAIDFLTAGLDLATGIGDRVGEGDLRSHLGVVYRNMGQYEQAADWQQQALTLFQAIGHRPGELDALTYLGDVHRLLRRPADAANHLDRALTLSRELGVRNTEALALAALGDTASDIGDPEQAIEHHSEVLALGTDGIDPYHRARAHAGLARAFVALDRHADADSHRKAALDLYAELGLPEALFAQLSGAE